MLSVTESFKEHQFIIAGAPSFQIDFYLPYLGEKNIPIIFNQTYDLLKNTDAALVTSGTATLETALFNIPQVVLYKGSKITISIARLLIDIKFISLVNLIMDKGIVKELLQEDCNTKMLDAELKNILDGKNRLKILEQNLA